MKDSLDEQLNAYLRDAHSIEEQAIAQLRAAPDLVGDERIASLFRDHLAETENHERLVSERLVARDASASTVKDVVMEAGGKGFVLFARLQPDTPGKLVTHAYSYEHLEQAGYAMLAQAARAAGDEDTAQTAARIEEEERAMGQRLEEHFDTSIQASIGGLEGTDLEDKLNASLADAHALETQAVALLRRASDIADDPTLGALFDRLRERSEGHLDRLQELLDRRHAQASWIKDATLRLGGLNWALFFQAQPDSASKLTAFAYAVVHLKIGGYAHLRGVAERAGDRETVAAVDAMLVDERQAAASLKSQFSHAVAVSLKQPV